MAIALCIVATLAAALVAYHAALAFRIWLHLRRIRKAGLPTSLDELNTWYPSPSDEPNAAPLYRRAFAWLAETEGRGQGGDVSAEEHSSATSQKERQFFLQKQIDTCKEVDKLTKEGRIDEATALLESDLDPEPQEGDVPAIEDAEFLKEQEPLDGAQIEQAARFLEDRHDILGLLHEAARIPYCRYTVDYTRDKAITFEDMVLQEKRTGVEDAMRLYDGVRSGVKLFCLEAVVLAAKGQCERAQDSVQAAIRLARSLDSLPMLMSHIVSAASANTILDTVEYLNTVFGAKCVFSPALCAAVSLLGDEDALRRAYIGERCFGLSCGFDPRGGWVLPGRRWLVAALAWAFRLAGLAKADKLRYLSKRNKQVEAAVLPVHLRTARFEEIRSSLRKPPFWHRWSDTSSSDELLICEVHVALLERVRRVQALISSG